MFVPGKPTCGLLLWREGLEWNPVPLYLFPLFSPLFYSFGNVQACESEWNCAVFLIPEHLWLSLIAMLALRLFVPPTWWWTRWPAGNHLHTFSVPSISQTHWACVCDWSRGSPPNDLWVHSTETVEDECWSPPGWPSRLYIHQHKLLLLCLSFT